MMRLLETNVVTSL